VGNDIILGRDLHGLRAAPLAMELLLQAIQGAIRGLHFHYFIGEAGDADKPVSGTATDDVDVEGAAVQFSVPTPDVGMIGVGSGGIVSAHKR
jgi:hypothetical protein